MSTAKTTDWQTIIQTIQAETGWTKRQLSEKTGITPQVISRLANLRDQTPTYENGRRLKAVYEAVTSGVNLKASA